MAHPVEPAVTEQHQERRTVAVLCLGGTIGMATDPDTGRAVPALTGSRLLEAVPGLDALRLTLRTRDLRQVPSVSLTTADLDELETAIAAELRAGADGVVVVQGTDTIEETAYYLDLGHDGQAPVVVTGAMRTPGQPGADGPANLHAALVAAASPRLRGAGCLVVLNNEIHTARRVRKSHTISPAAFTSPGAGPLGGVVEGRVRLLHGLPPRATLPAAARRPGTPGAVPVVRVPVHTMTLGDDGTVLGLVEGHCDGLVVAAFGAGHVPERVVPVLERLAAGVPVVLTSRIGNGPLLRGTYGFPGSESDLLARGLIHGGDLDPYKARLLLYRLLAAGWRDRDRIGAVFAGPAAGN